MKKIVSIIMGILLLLNSMSVIVEAEEKNINEKADMYMSAVEADSQIVSMETGTDEDDGRYVFDGFLLKQVKNNGEVVVENDYNDKGFRIAKKGIDNCKFTYDENKNLIEEERNGKIITYFYKEDEEYQYWHFIGFSYEGENYYYTKDELNRINGIKNENGDLIARYEYGLDNNKVEKVLKEEEGEWVCTENEEFIGNINRIRKRESYYDVECDLYYDNRMFCYADTSKLVWNNNNIQILPLSDSYDLDYQVYCWQQSLLNDNTFNAEIEKEEKWYVGLSDVAVVARIIYGENTSVIVDQNAIANVIRNRAVDKNMTAREIVLEKGQFSTAEPTDIVISQKYPTDEGWQNAVHKACLLCWTLEKDDWDSLNSIPYGMGQQKCFRSIKNNYSNFSGANPMHYDKASYHTPAYHAYIAGYGEVNSYSTLYSIKDRYLNQNIYFSETNY